MAGLTLSFGLLYLLAHASARTQVPVHQNTSCNSVERGYECFNQISHLWGQYSPYFSVPAEGETETEHLTSIPQDIPQGCTITFAQVLSRHGARFPSEKKSVAYKSLIESIQKNVTASAGSFTGKYAFLGNYSYTLGSDDLTAFGEDQLVDSGTKFYQRYQGLAERDTPFVRASGSDRVVASAEKFAQGYTAAQAKDGFSGDVTVNVIIPEEDGFNNTLDHSTCTRFENDERADEIEAAFTALVVPPIRKRLENDLPGVTLNDDEVIYLMDMCSFDTVARTPDGTDLSPFCALFSESEWRTYDYIQSLSKYYGYGGGSPLGPAQGIGFTNELIARLTKTPVHDNTSTNRTLDSNPSTFPLNRTLYADFSHDNSMISIFFAMGLYNGTAPLSKTHVQSIAEMDGYAASWAVPFGARAYVEGMTCAGREEELVRVLVNDRVVPLHGCDVDELGRCTVRDWVEGLGFAREGGNWRSCFSS